MAVLMAGGKGTRMDSSIEKPLFKFKSKPLIDYVLENLSTSDYIESIIVATSCYTPKTKEYLDERKFNNINVNYTTETNNIKKDANVYGYDSHFYNYIETPGKGYLEDLSFLLSIFEKRSKKDVLLIINADLPFVSSKIIDNILNEYLKNDIAAMSVFVPLSLFNKHGLKPSYVFNKLVPSGLNILLSQNKIQMEDKLIISKIELALNINTPSDVKVANCLFDNKQIKDISANKS